MLRVGIKGKIPADSPSSGASGSILPHSGQRFLKPSVRTPHTGHFCIQSSSFSSGPAGSSAADMDAHAKRNPARTAVFTDRMFAHTAL